MNVQRKEKRKTVLRTIRIDRELDDALYKDAQENDINENALISSILDSVSTEIERLRLVIGFTPSSTT